MWRHGESVAKRKKRSSLSEVKKWLIRNMDSSSSEEEVKKKGWLLVNQEGSIEHSSDEEPAASKLDSVSTNMEEATSQETPSLTPLPLGTYSPTQLASGSPSSGESTLVSSQPSPHPGNNFFGDQDRVVENLSTVADILTANVEKEDSQSVESFEVLTEESSADGGASCGSRNEGILDEDMTDPVPIQAVRMTSDSDSDFVKLTEPSEVEEEVEEELAPSGLEVKDGQDSSDQSEDPISSSSESGHAMPQSAPYRDVNQFPSEEESDHIRIMSRRWPTEDGGFLLVQRYRKVDPDTISTISSSISDISGFSMIGGSSSMLSNTQEEIEDSDTESDASTSSFESKETLPVNVTVRNVLPAERQYLHHRNDVFNSKLTIFAVFVLTAGLTLGIGHFVGSSQIASHHNTLQEGQKLRLRSLQDELVSCMDKRKDSNKLLYEQEKEVQQCTAELKEMATLLSEDQKQEETGELPEDVDEHRLCGQCHGELRYSKFCNLKCPSDAERGHSWVAMGIVTFDRSNNHDSDRAVTVERQEEQVTVFENTLPIDETESTEDKEVVAEFDTTESQILPVKVEYPEAKWVCIAGSDEDCSEWVTKDSLSMESKTDKVETFAVDVHDDEESLKIEPQAESDNSNMLVFAEEPQDNVGEGEMLEGEDNSQMKGDEEEITGVPSSIQQSIESAWSVLEDASRSLLNKNISLQNATETMKEHVQGLKEVVKTTWDSVQTVATQVNEDTLQPMINQVTKMVYDQLPSGRGRKRCKGGGRKWRRNGKVHRQVVGKKNGKNASPSIFDGNGNRNDFPFSKNLAKNVKKATKHAEKIQVAHEKEAKEIKPKSMKTDEVKRAQKHVDEMLTTPKPNMETKSDQSVSPQDYKEKSDTKSKEMVSGNQKTKKKRSQPPPKLNIEKVLDSLDMSCGGELRCVENHKMDATRLLKEMINYRQWLWEQRFRKDVDEVEDFMEELEEFIDEENVDDDDIEDLKDEFEDMMEDIQKTTKKFFKKQENGMEKSGKKSNKQETKSKNWKRGQKGKKGKQDETVQQKAGERKLVLGASDEGGSELHREDNEGAVPKTVNTVTFNIQDLPSVKSNNSFFGTTSSGDEESLNKKVISGEVRLPPDHGDIKVEPSERKSGTSYVNTENWFFRRASGRELRRIIEGNSGWYFERLKLRDESRKKGDKNDWYFQRGEQRESSRGCVTQPLLCDWAKDESVVTVWEMYKWLTERFSMRADMRAWDLDDQINWFLRKP